MKIPARSYREDRVVIGMIAKFTRIDSRLVARVDESEKFLFVVFVVSD